MDRTIYWLAAIDAVLIAAFAYVYEDLLWRTAYAESVHTACTQGCSYSASFSFGVLTRVFTMAGNGVVLTSPLTLDWVQVILVLLVVANGLYAFSFLRSRRAVHAAVG